MTTADDAPEVPQADDSAAANKKPKKKKSAGFIETTSFKPSWLETGPLTPDMLPPELVAQVVAEVRANDDISDDLLAQINELERLYNESLEAEAEAPPVVEAPPIVIEEAAIEEIEPAQSPDIEIEAPFDTPEVAPDLPLEATEVVVEERRDAPHHLEVVDPVTYAVVDLPASPDETFEALPETEETAAEVEAVGDAPTAEAVAVVLTTEAKAKPLKPVKQRKPRRAHPLFDRLGRILLIVGLILLGLAALTYFVNPFARLALSTAKLARPISSPTIASPAGAETNWCVTGNFLADGAAPLPMQDGGRQGDIVAGDKVFALQTNTLEPGIYQWQVVGCELGDLAYPEATSWIQVDTANQPVTFLFDSEKREDALFFPIPFAVSAIDSASTYQIVGSFQDWNPDDASTVLQHLGGGLYQQVRRIARPGVYEAYIISGNTEQAVDAYGRTTDPIPFSFETTNRGDAVVFLLDTNRGRASVLYGMPWIATQLAYGPGFRVLSLILGLVGLFLLTWMLLRMIMMGNKKNWLDAGCPQCEHQELMRISRRPMDRLLNTFGIPAYRYQCRHCTWTGTRLSEDGASVSPGATTIMTDNAR